MSGTTADSIADYTEDDIFTLSDQDHIPSPEPTVPSDHGDTPSPGSTVYSDHEETSPPDISNLIISGDVASILNDQAMSTLSLMLSLATVLSPKIQEEINQQEPAPSTAPFCSVGRGYCGEIYEKRRTGRIFKRELPGGVKKLWNDYIWHTSIHNEILRANVHYEKIRITDGQGVEFILASSSTSPITLTARDIKKLSPNTDTSSLLSKKMHTSQMWLLDFSNCSEITMDEAGVRKANDAFWDNDLYYPRPRPEGDQDWALWGVFRDAYVEDSANFARVDVSDEGLPEMLLTLLKRRQRGEGNGWG
ncbi:hypothetical protein IFR05_014176 [Cadophora sp. M221]|nr:hypothetical protein IFR05_014176 [Cadophora sp. M221]